MLDRIHRAEAIALTKSHISELGELDLTPGPSGEIAAVLAEIKVKRYVLFAQLIDEQVDIIDKIRQSQVTPGFPLSPYRHRSRNDFGKLRLDALKVFIEAAETLEGSHPYQLLEDLSELRGKLDPEYGYINPMGQFAAGSDTAITTMLNLLKNLPRIAQHHFPETTFSEQEIVEIARRSVGLPLNIAMISINQMMALQATSANQLLHKGWAEFDFDIDPTIFRPNFGTDGKVQSLRFNDLDSLHIPAGYRFLEEHPPLPQDTPLSDIPDTGPAPIGCPITLLPRRLQKLWNWFIDDIQRDGLWNQGNNT